ncbi:hypothetical protein EVAR_50933_1 [Eumeta japonica]|uniref:Uncharacterized protein n=1 Tax=Eumeta variegata TaxID=151549 RepID=A0A4C1Y1K5_EUMVA|nr:hypothetical protein EVAR_50933_1 [Eumeta japonica]
MEECSDTQEFPRKTNTNNSSSKSVIKKGRKGKRISSDSSNEDISKLPANSLEVEKSLQATAAKNNINDTGMKKLLKKVVLNDHVLAIVKLREEEGSGNEEDNLSVKLTRSKAKQLKKPSPNWELTPIKHIPVKTRPEVEALIAQELPDESDEEYSPTHDDVPSDEDQTLESCSDIESQPRTPGTPRNQTLTSSEQCIKDGPFKVPQELKTSTKRRLELEEEATIALRTRSKLSLSETPIEHIEQSFVPPDEPPATVVDDLWNKFLEECLDPAPSFRNEDDDETDPEYNVAADPDAQDEDEETLENSLIKISKKELTDLMSELMQLMPEDVDIQTDQNTEQVENCGKHFHPGETIGKLEPIPDEQTEITLEVSDTREFRRNSCVSIGKSEPISDEENWTLPNKEETHKVTTENRISEEVKNSNNNVKNSETLNSSRTPLTDCGENATTKSGDSNIVTINFQERTKTISHAYQEPVVPTILKNTLQKDLETHKIEIRFNPATDKLVIQTCTIRGRSTHCARAAAGRCIKAVMPTKVNVLYLRGRLASYLGLMACGLDQFWQYVVENPALFKLPSRSHECRRYGLTHVIDLMRRYMFPWLSNSTIQAHINHIRRLNDPLFFAKRDIIPVKHKLLSFNPNITLYEQPDHEMPLIWLRYIKSMSQKRFISSRVKIQGVEPQGVEVNIGKTIELPKKLPLPKDFTKMFKRNKHNKMITIPQKSCDDYNPIQIHINTNTTQNENAPTATSTAITSTATIPAAQKVTNLFNLVQTSVGAYLIPLTVVQSTTVVNSVQTPITTPNHDSTVVNNKIPDDEFINKPPKLSSTIHFSDDDISEPDEPCKSKIGNVRAFRMDCCKCCNIYRSYIKRQRKITEYFFHDDNQRSEVALCPCQHQRLHKTNVTNRLKLLVQNYRVCSYSIWRHLDEKILKLKSKDDDKKDKKLNDQSYDIMDSSENADCKHKSADYDSLKDIVFVTMFLMKILSGSATLKKLMSNHLTKFDPDADSPVYLFNKLSGALKGEDFQITKDFVRFLTPQQALKVNRFGTYLLVMIMPLLISRIEEDVTENEVKISLLSELSSLSNKVGEFSPCDMCEKLLKHTKKYRKLTELIFSLFPHRRKR